MNKILSKNKDKKSIMLRRASRGRIKIKSLKKVRLCVHRTSRHIYAQVISDDGRNVIAAASTNEKDQLFKKQYTGNKLSAVIVGKKIAERAIAKNITNVTFDRSGFKYHGRVKALADSARDNGLKF